VIYLFKEIEKIKKKDMLKYKSLLSLERLKYIKEYKYENDRKKRFIAFILLRIALDCEFNIIECPEIKLESTFKKPYLKDYNNIKFNFSHCNKGVICAISTCNVGVDIQEVEPYIPSTFNDILTNNEILLLNNNNNKDILFTKIWNCKEAFGKSSGEGIIYNLNEYDFCEVIKNSFRKYEKEFGIYEFEGFSIAYCSNKHMDIKILTYEELIAKCEEYKNKELLNE